MQGWLQKLLLPAPLKAQADLHFFFFQGWIESRTWGMLSKHSTLNCILTLEMYVQCVWVSCLHVRVYAHAFIVSGALDPVTGVVDGYEPGPLQEQQVLLPSEPSLQPPCL